MSAFDRFPRIVERLDQLESSEQQVLAAAGVADPCDFIVRFPPFDISLSTYVRRKTRGKTKEPPLLGHVWAHRENQHYLLRRTTEQIHVEHFVLEELLTFELGEILLHDWIELEIQDGMQTRVLHLDFNAVGLQWIAPLVNNLRSRTHHASIEYPPHLESDIAQFPYKWQMLAHMHARVYGEAADNLVYVPSIPPRWLRRTGREGKLALRMPQHIVLVREPLVTYPHGWIAKSCLRSDVQHAAVVTTEQTAVLELTLGSHAFKWQIEMPRAQAEALAALSNELTVSAAVAVS